ncbi:FAD-binding oxidoreductase [Patescibacteria group bacterium]|nr:FAD-binding oxidoreductase [Patescibacteria group bacterium]
MSKTYSSWGRYPEAPPQQVVTMPWTTDALPTGRPLLAYGLGRSYGDSCLNEGGTLIDVTVLNHLLHFDVTQGILRVEAGMSLADILEYIVPKGWFLPVTPGTKFVTVGGAIANDVHGKNHHRDGTFGCHVRAFELVRSTGERYVCTPTQNKELFTATIGGLGLTGLITWAEIQLKKIASPWIRMQAKRFHSLEEFFALSEATSAEPYSAAWLDTTARGREFGRGIFLHGDHASAEEGVGMKKKALPSIRIPCDAPAWVLNRATIRAFNTCYFYAPIHKAVPHLVSYNPFFYPLDAVLDWNRLYGRRGFLQYQCVLPPAHAKQGMSRLLETSLEHGLASFLSVLKVFGAIPSPGLLSFPCPGTTLAMDVPFEGQKTLDALTHLDAIVTELGGRLYPAKDARMSAQDFKQFYPMWETFSASIDPAFSSSFWRRVMS